MNKQVFWSIGAAVVLTVAVVAAALALLSSGGGDEEASGPGADGPDASGASSAPGASPAEQGQAADVPARPDCPEGTVAGVELDCLGGQESAAEASADSGVTIVNVWAWWCQPCREELPLLEEVATTHPEWEVIGVHADTNAANGAALLEELGVGLPSFQDSDNTFAGELGLPRVIPITLVLKDGAEAGRFVQAFESTAEIESAVTGALDG